MTLEDYRTLWKETIHLCEIETDEEQAKEFVWHYYSNTNGFENMSDRDLLITFVGLVVYETRFFGINGLGSATPAKFCYRELYHRNHCNLSLMKGLEFDKYHLDKISTDGMGAEFVLDLGDWAAEYATNSYIPMDTYRGFGPREHYAFWKAYETRVTSEQLAKAERIAKLREEGRKKVEAAKAKHKARLETINELRNKPVEECIEIIESSDKSVFYYIELIVEWFRSKSLDDETKTYILSMFPLDSTRHNIRLRKRIEDLY